MTFEAAERFGGRGTGWKADESVYVEASEKFGSIKPGAAPTDMPKGFNVLGRHCLLRDQVESSACVGFADTGAALARLRLLGYDPTPFSPAALYAITRMLERLGEGKIPLTDQGSFPFLALTAMRSYGLLPEKEHPFSIDTINNEIDFDDFQKASQFRISSFRRIDSARRINCMRKLVEGKPIPLGMQVGTEFSKYRRGLGPVGVETDDTGGHMTFLVGYEDFGEIFIGCNSWGKDYGDEGFYRIHRSKLEHASTTDLVEMNITDAPAPAGTIESVHALITALHKKRSGN